MHRTRRIGHTLASALGAALLLGLVPPSAGAAADAIGAPSSRSARVAESRVLELVNAARAQGRRCGRERYPAAAPVRLSATLTRAANAHARDMARHGFLEHTGSDGSAPRDRLRRAGYRWRLTGENIAYGPTSAEEVVEGWLASPGHCANIMDARFREMGIALAVGRTRLKPLYWAQVFAAPQVEAAL
jgi:uncharacterized protein YkwD